MKTVEELDKFIEDFEAARKNKPPTKPVKGFIASTEGMKGLAMISCEQAEKLKRYEEAEADGRLFIAPCKLGDLIYQRRNKNHANGAGFSPRRVSCFTFWSNGKYAVNHTGMTPCIGDELNKTWFLSKPNADK